MKKKIFSYKILKWLFLIFPIFIQMSYGNSTTGSIHFHYYYGVPTSGDDVISLDGNKIDKLVLSNIVAGVFLGNLIHKIIPNLSYDRDYVYGTIFAQLLQENIATQLYKDNSHNSIDSSPSQASVMGNGQGGPYQINNYAVDMIDGTYTANGGSLVNFVALQKNIGYTLNNQGRQHGKNTPNSFNNVYYAPLLVAYFHYLDLVALNEIGMDYDDPNSHTIIHKPWEPNGTAGWTPSWQPAFCHMKHNSVDVSNFPIDLIINIAYNAGFYSSLFSTTLDKLTNPSDQVIKEITTYSNQTYCWGKNDSYVQYPMQCRGYIDQLYNKKTTDHVDSNKEYYSNNHLIINLSTLGNIFTQCMHSLGYINSTGNYDAIPVAEIDKVYNTSLQSLHLTADQELDLSETNDRNKIFQILETAIPALEKDLNFDFGTITNQQLIN